MMIKILCDGRAEEGLRKLLANAVDIQGCGIKIKPYEGIATLLRKLDDQIKAELLSGAQVVFCLVDYFHYPLSDEGRPIPIDKRIEAIKSDMTSQSDSSRHLLVKCHVVVREKVYVKCPTFKQLVDDLRTHCQK